MWAEPLYTAAEMRAAEEAFPGTTLELMERAGAAVFEAVVREHGDARRFAVACGTGANGGDGFVVARKLHEAGRDVRVLLVGSEEKVTGDAAENLRRARQAGIRFADGWDAPDVVVDAVFGTGFAGAPRDEAGERIAELNALEAPVVAVDLPSGVDASTGEVEGPAVKAAHTVTFHGRKVGLAVAPGRFYAGEVVVADIGLEPVETTHRLVTEAILELVPRRGPEDNKYSAGTVLVVGGSPGLSGAPSLTAEAALRAGAGYAIVCAPEAINAVLEQRLVEPVTRPLPSDDDGRLTPAAADDIVTAAERADAVALGPGLGRSEGTRELVRVLLERLDIPVVLDADGLWAAAERLYWVEDRRAATVLTPHEGELAALFAWASSEVGARRLVSVQQLADVAQDCSVLKGADTLVAVPDAGVFVCDLGNPGLATAGTGDVLTGAIAAFLAKGMEPPLAAAAAAAACGVAADLAAERHGQAGMVARDVIESLSLALS